MRMQNDQIPDASTDDNEEQEQPTGFEQLPMPPLVIGTPFAIAYGAEYVDRDQVEPGCVLIVKCEGRDERGCNQMFRVNLLDAGDKNCPRCGQKFAHMVLFAPADDDEIVRDAMLEVLIANGYGHMVGAPSGGESAEVPDDEEGETEER